MIAASLLLATVFAFLLPALSLRAPTTFGDAPVESVPRVFAIARAVQSGGLPLWDFNTFAGARPFYVTNESAIFYPLAYPFYWLADLDDVEAATVMLVLLPYVIHLLWAALGAYVFARLALGLVPLGAAVTGLVWALSPEMGVQIHTPDVAYLFAWLPWVMLALARFVESGSCRWWVAGAMSLGLLASVGTPNFIVRTYFLAAVTGSVLWLAGVLRRQVPGTRLLPLMAMFLIGLGLNAFAWVGVFEGIDWMRGQLGEITATMASDMWSESSMPPSYLAVLFIPSFFGVLDNAHAWGVALEEGVTNLSALSGGLALVGAMLAAVGCGLRRGENSRLRLWIWLAVGIQVVTLLTMMGRYTPVFDWLCTALPWFFEIPHAVYYRFAQCWSAAVLAGIGVSVLLTNRSYRERALRLRWGWAVFGLTLAATAWPLLQPKPGEDSYIAAYKQLFDLEEGPWFASDPLTYLGVALGLAIVGLTFLPLRLRPIALAMGVCVEVLRFGVPVFYESLLYEQTREPPDYEVVIQDERYRTAADHPHGRVGQEVAAQSRQRGVRFVGFNSRVDNQAWLWDGQALLGYSSKPLEPRFRAAVQQFTDGMPYDLMFRRVPALSGGTSLDAAGYFLRNMNVGLIVGNLDAPPTWMNQTHGLEVLSLPEPLPYAYFQDVVVELGEDEQQARLLGSDLRRAAYVPPGTRPGFELSPDRGTGAATRDDVERFARLQERNQVISTDRRQANRQVLEVEVAEPTLLVVAETWHEGWTAQIDGAVAQVLRVNDLQQGLFVEPGRHRIELSFFPPALGAGFLASGLSGLLLILAGVLPRRRRTESEI